MDYGSVNGSILAVSPHVSISTFTEPRDPFDSDMPGTGGSHVASDVVGVYPGWCVKGPRAG